MHGPTELVEVPPQHSALRTQHLDRSALSTQHSSVDPDNQLLWSMRLRRLESESVRDVILAVSGGLNRSLGGPPLPLDADAITFPAIVPSPSPHPQSPHPRSSICRDRIAVNSSANPSNRWACLFTSEVNLL